MVRQRKHDGNKQAKQERRPRPPKESPKVPAENMQYVSNSRSKARLLQVQPLPGPLWWLLRLRITRLFLLLVVTSAAGFIFGRVFHWGLIAQPDGSFEMHIHQNENHPHTFHQEGINNGAAKHHVGNGLEDNRHHVASENDTPLQQPIVGQQHGAQQPVQHNAAQHQLSEKDDIAKQRAYNKHHAQRQAAQQAGQQHAAQHQAGQQGVQQHDAQQHADQHVLQQQAAQQAAAKQAVQQGAQQHAVQQPPIAKQPGDPIQSPQKMASNQHAGQQSADAVLQAKRPLNQDAPSDIETYPNHVIQTLTNIHKLPHLKNRFIECTKSILDKASINLHFFFVVDEQSHKFVMDTLQDITNQHIAKSKFQFHFIAVDELAQQLAPLVSMLQESVSGGHPYYQDAIFFLSVAIHRGILPNYVKRVLMLDTDLKFMADIKELFDHFDQFTSNNIMGMAREMQPVYRHLLSLYRSQNKGTKVGDPPPDGLTGFNSGVVLLDLEKMRTSAAYQGFVNAEKIHELSNQYHFKGHLGDQDFFTLISLARPDLFHILPCSWNRQLCVWWRDKGYTDVFDLYFNCPGKIDVYHGNCNTPIPY